MQNQILPVTYLNWMMLWINAINDAYLWVDAPDCFFIKANHLQWNNDLNSTIRKANWEHRIMATIADVDNIIDNRNSKLIKSIYEIYSREFVKILFVSSMPMSQIIWFDYNKLVNSVEIINNKPLINIPSRSMSDCWLDWYSDLLFQLAKNIELVENKKNDKKNVAIVWNLFDRNEWDAIGNVIELKNIFKWLWINIVSIWLDWWNYEELLNFKQAWTIVSLPYWRKAAKTLAKRMWVWLLELDLPFGINNTINFIKQIWDYFDIDENIIDNFIKEELTINNDIWILRNTIQSFFMNKIISYYWDPYLLNWIFDIANTIWFNVNQIFIHWKEKHLKNNIEQKEINNEYLYDFAWNNVDRNFDVFIWASNTMFEIKDLKKITFWFPSYEYHCFTQIPYYWIKWSLNFINRIYNILIAK